MEAEILEEKDVNLVEKLIKSDEVYHGKLLHVYNDTVKLPNGKTATREWIRHPGAAAVIPILDDGRIVLVKQYRYPTGKVTLEIPAGKLDQGEEPLVCARRELKEETGYTTNSLVKMAEIGTTMAFSNEIIHLYIAKDLVAGDMCPDEDEFINTVILNEEEIEKLIASGQINDAKTLTALLLMKRENLYVK